MSYEFPARLGSTLRRVDAARLIIAFRSESSSIATSKVARIRHTQKMGWFSSSSASSAADSAAAPAAAAGPAAAAPDRSQRAQCWTSRDAYFGCLDKNNVQAPGQEGEGVCKAENDEYRTKCAASWVSSPSFQLRPFRRALSERLVSQMLTINWIAQVDYFNKRRVLALRQDLMERRAADQVREMASGSNKRA